MSNKNTKIFGLLIGGALAMVLTLGMVDSAIADSSTGPWTINDTNTNRSCGTNLTNDVEYACATITSGGSGSLLTKVKDSWVGNSLRS